MGGLSVHLEGSLASEPGFLQPWDRGEALVLEHGLAEGKWCTLVLRRR